MKCIQCGKFISDKEFRARYDELSAQGIVPMMVPMCRGCRGLDLDKIEAEIAEIIPSSGRENQ